MDFQYGIWGFLKNFLLLLILFEREVDSLLPKYVQQPGLGQARSRSLAQAGLHRMSGAAVLEPSRSAPATSCGEAEQVRHAPGTVAGGIPREVLTTGSDFCPSVSTSLVT